MLKRFALIGTVVPGIARQTVHASMAASTAALSAAARTVQLTSTRQRQKEKEKEKRGREKVRRARAKATTRIQRPRPEGERRSHRVVQEGAGTHPQEMGPIELTI